MANSKFIQKSKFVLKKNLMPCLTMFSVIIAIIVGILIRSHGITLTSRQLMYLRYVGELFLRALKCLVIPIMVTSLISALSGMETGVFKRIGRYACYYYIITTIIAVCLGIALVLIIKPGAHSKHSESKKVVGTSISVRNTSTVDTLLDLIRNLIPDNLFEATIRTTYTEFVKSNEENIRDIFVLEKTDAANVMGIVFISIVVGLTIGSVGDNASVLRRFFIALNEVIMKITVNVVRFTPVGVFFLILTQILAVSNVQKCFENIAWFTCTALFGLFFHAIVVLPALYFIYTRKNPYKVIWALSNAVLMGFGTGSSTATLPVTIDCLEKNLGIDSRVTRTLIPIGSVINMDGTALYEALAAIFIAQMRDVELSLTRLIITSITATAASVGAAGIPQAGLVTMVVVLHALGLPAEDISLIIMVDWFIDRFRTVVNIIGDSFGAALIYYICAESLDDVGDPIDFCGDNNNVFFRENQQIKRTHNSLNNINDKFVQLTA